MTKKNDLADRVAEWAGDKAAQARIEKKVTDGIVEKFGEQLIDTPKFKTDLLNAAIDRKRCPLISMPEDKWRCDKETFDGITYHKGQEPCCHTGEHLNCPVFDAYYRYGIPSIAAKRRKKEQKRRE